MTWSSAMGSRVPKSDPTIARTPARPTNSPKTPVRVSRSVPRVARANTVPMSGVAAMSSAVSELERCCSADPSSTHGMAISIAAKTAIQRQWTRTARRSIRSSATGSRMAVATLVRRNTRVAGVISATAILMNRYGMPQMIAIETNRIRPRRVIASSCPSPTHLSMPASSPRTPTEAPAYRKNTPKTRTVARADERKTCCRGRIQWIAAVGSRRGGIDALSDWSRAATPGPR